MAQSPGIKGQTMTPVPLGGDRLLVLSNRRYGKQGIVLYIVNIAGEQWVVEHESMLWDARTETNCVNITEADSGIEAFDDFAFGLPSAIMLDTETFLAVHWCKEDGVFGIRWTKGSVLS